jgi:hypothetical protein
MGIEPTAGVNRALGAGDSGPGLRTGRVNGPTATMPDLGVSPQIEFNVYLGVRAPVRVD